MSGCLILNVIGGGGGARRAFAGMQASTDSGVAAPFVQAHDAKIRSWLSELIWRMLVLLHIVLQAQTKSRTSLEC